METSLPPIPPKRYFTIGEVSELCQVKPYVLRYWEQEFIQLKPQKRRGNRRYYQHHEVLLVRRIRDLLYEQGFTISGARNRLGDIQALRNLVPPELRGDDGSDGLDSIDSASLSAADALDDDALEDGLQALSANGALMQASNGHASGGRKPVVASAAARKGHHAVRVETPLKLEGELTTQRLRTELLNIRRLLDV
jgi:DNA-binding transcriptional MerR regulator